MAAALAGWVSDAAVIGRAAAPAHRRVRHTPTRRIPYGASTVGGGFADDDIDNGRKLGEDSRDAPWNAERRPRPFPTMNVPVEPPGKPGLTPMLAHYREVKAAHPDCLVFYRMGDFYELFFDDAVAAAGALDIT
ncbi:MAG: hypothetical protein OXH64_02930, partial [Rhodospirillaceae bacterium]|nr:hypothetical protein [Rhodospirillaceae bacterium]